MLKNEGLQVEVWREVRPLSHQELVDKSMDCQGLLSTGSNAINKEFLDKCSHLKVISQFGAGYDNIDVEYARALGISVGNAPGCYE